MKILFTSMCLLFCLCASLAQNIEYGYDAAGNRIFKKPAGALPVTLISFTAEKSLVDASGDATALLSWETSAEVNADRFSIQNSQDGKKWLEIGSVQATGASAPGASAPGASAPGASAPGASTPGEYATESTDEEFLKDDEISNTYTFIDKVPAEGENLYRLKMIDKDGSFAYSQVRNLNFELNIRAYPNPVSDLITLKWSALQTVQIFNNSGNMVYETSEQTSTIDVSKLSGGVYIFKLIGNDGSSILRKIVKK